jgi:hypothetical protein
MEINIKETLRPCIVKGRKALFHRWSDKGSIIPPSPMIGGHNGGTFTVPIAIIEYDDGAVVECFPSEVKFVDSKIKEFAFCRGMLLCGGCGKIAIPQQLGIHYCPECGQGHEVSKDGDITVVNLKQRGEGI